MKLLSKSKRQLIRYVQLLRKNLKSKQVLIDRLVSECVELADRLNTADYEIGQQDRIWFGRLREAEEIHELKTADLKRCIGALTDMLVHRELLRLNPPIFVALSNSSLSRRCSIDAEELIKLKEKLCQNIEVNALLTIERDNLQSRMNALERIIAKSV